MSFLDTTEIIAALKTFVAHLWSANLETVQNIYRVNPSALTAGLLLNICTYGAKPGVVNNLVTQQSDLVQQAGPEFFGMDRDPFPILKSEFPSRSDALQWRYSRELMTAVFRLCAQEYAAQPFSGDKYTLLFDDAIFGRTIFPPPGQRFSLRSPYPPPLLRTALDLDCITAMCSAGLLKYFNTNKCGQWEPTAFLQLVKYFLSNPKQTVLNMGAFPDSAALHKENLPSFFNNPTYKALSENCTIATVGLNLPPKTNPLAVSFFQDSVALMPQLVNLLLCLSSDGLQIAAPTIRHLLAKEGTTLVDLVTRITEHNDNSNKEQSLQVVLEVLKTNKTLQNFAFRNDQGPALVQTYEKCLVDVLKTANVTLETAEFRSEEYCSQQLPSNGQLGYYTTLNQYERGLLQKIKEWNRFAAILTRATTIIRQGRPSDLDRVNITFGLLMAQIHFFTGSSSHQTHLSPQ
ncbi:expressed unknown protein [Seminavis robusta]|uniref:Uncharacterized protein n=1 Tax=Seminavis robusta TaxID=568900 RepID=A0A9N8E5I9_9STRA|nr:expressed unknown protein [Seminavis robusta]|eukprot:Sro694_g188500.1 n/a (461) ;mRNA; r:34886-36648